VPAIASCSQVRTLINYNLIAQLAKGFGNTLLQTPHKQMMQLAPTLS